MDARNEKPIPRSDAYPIDRIPGKCEITKEPKPSIEVIAAIATAFPV